MEVYFLQTFIGYVIDRIIGDPQRLPHPVVLIGRTIEYLEKVLRKCAATPMGLKSAGLILAIIVIVMSYLAASFILAGLCKVNYYCYLLGGAWIISTTIASKGLADAAMEIKGLLISNDLPQARQRVGWIVGRDSKEMENEELVRATVETVAENINDAIVAPLFYALIGGPAAAMAYRAINTLDSMLGYKNEKYLYFGWAAARIDDAAGYIPARLTGLMLLAAAWLSNRDWRRAYRVWRRDALKHPSPNSGIPESVMAGSIGVRLGGRNVYGQVISYRPYLGDPVEALRADHITRAVDMLYLSSSIGILVISLMVWSFIFFIKVL